MEAKATAKYVRVSPRKAGQICDLVRGKNVDEALAILKFTPRGAAEIIAKVVKSAKANAENNHEMDADKLYVALSPAWPAFWIRSGSRKKAELPQKLNVCFLVPFTFIKT